MMKRTTTVIFCIVLLSGLVATAGNFRYVSGGRLAVDKRYDADVDPVLEKRLRSWQSRLEGQMNQVIGHCDRTLSVEHPEGSLNNLCTDMLLAQTREVIGLPADAALLNNRGIRRSLPQGDITVGMVYEALPFDDEVVVLELKGSDLQRLVEAVARRGTETFANIRLTVRGNRLESFTIGGEELDPDRIYRLATIDYLAAGSGGMSPLRRALSSTPTGHYLRDCMIREIEMLTRAGQTVKGEVDGRFKRVEP
ncbi:MAG: 5'-nucleotidase C-terminal domain-containing protein [Bacteroidales bacterium]|nr:5'-nucleotidase C-terminal domain-containing protein [Bacteroidales bacterium]